MKNNFKIYGDRDKKKNNKKYTYPDYALTLKFSL